MLQSASNPSLPILDVAVHISESSRYQISKRGNLKLSWHAFVTHSKKKIQSHSNSSNITRPLHSGRPDISGRVNAVVQQLRQPTWFANNYLLTPTKHLHKKKKSFFFFFFIARERANVFAPLLMCRLLFKRLFKRVFACGPQDMINTAWDAAVAQQRRGFDVRFHKEVFNL